MVPPSDDLSIMYPATKLPLILDEFQFKLICDEDTALAVRSLGDGNTGSTGLLGITGTGTGLRIGGNIFPSSEVVDGVDFVIGIRSPDTGDINALDVDSKRNPKNSAVIIFVLLSIFFP